MVSRAYNADSDQTGRSDSLLEEYDSPLLCNAQAKVEVCFNFGAPPLSYSALKWLKVLHYGRYFEIS